MSIRAILYSTLLSLAIPNLGAWTDSLSVEEKKSAVFLETVSIPTTGEFFAAIAKESSPAWCDIPKTILPPPSPSREQLALQLGFFIADGFLGTEAQDPQGVKNSAHDLFYLAKKLNLSQSIQARGQSISDFAKDGAWNSLQEELEATRNDIRLGMQEQKDTHLLVFLTTGIWIRGMDIAVHLAAANPKPALTSLLVQPAIISHLISRLSGMPENTLSLSITQKILHDLNVALQLSQLYVDAPMPDAAVHELATIMTSLTTIVETPAKP
jgi:hypothetical protein